MDDKIINKKTIDNLVLCEMVVLLNKCINLSNILQ